MNVHLIGGPYDGEENFETEGNTAPETLRLSVSVTGGGGSKWNLYRPTGRTDSDGRPIYEFFHATEDDSDWGESVD